jgi:hypothetical protein
MTFILSLIPILTLTLTLTLILTLVDLRKKLSTCETSLLTCNRKTAVKLRITAERLKVMLTEISEDAQEVRVWVRLMIRLKVWFWRRS